MSIESRRRQRKNREISFGDPDRFSKIREFFSKKILLWKIRLRVEIMDIYRANEGIEGTVEKFPPIILCNTDCTISFREIENFRKSASLASKWRVFSGWRGLKHRIHSFFLPVPISSSVGIPYVFTGVFIYAAFYPRSCLSLSPSLPLLFCSLLLCPFFLLSDEHTTFHVLFFSLLPLFHLFASSLQTAENHSPRK